MWLWLVAIDIEVPRCSWQPYFHSLHTWSNLHLAPQPARMRESKGQVQHVVFLLNWSFQLVIDLLVQNDMTCRTSQRGVTGSFKLYLIDMSDFQQVLANLRCDFFLQSFLSVDKPEFDSAK